MNSLSFDIILEKIKENESPKWTLYFDMGGRRSPYPSDIFNPSYSKDELTDIIGQSTDKLQHVIDGYKKEFAGQKYFFISIEKGGTSNGKNNRFEYNFFINGENKSQGGHQYELGAIPAGMIPADHLEQKLNIVREQMKLDMLKRELEMKEKDISEKTKLLDSDANMMAKGFKKALMDIYNVIIDDDDISLKGIPGEKEKSPSDDKKTVATEKLAEFVFENFNSAQDVQKLLEIVKQYVTKKQSKTTE